jgi:hypothetical protein
LIHLFRGISVLHVFLFFALPLFANDSLDYEQLKSWIQKNQLTSVEDVLASLDKQTQWDVFGRAIPLEVSRSLQGANAENPRVIVPNKDGSFIFAFSNLHAANALETMQFNAKLNRFDFYEIRFPANPGKPVEFNGGAKCFGCHKGSPNWQPYAFWPGGHGSV